MVQCGNGYIARSEHVVADGFRGVQFQQTHMLVCGSVKNDSRLMSSKRLFDAASLCYINQERFDGEPRKTLVQLAVDVKQAVLRFIQQQESFWLSCCDLAGELRADTASGTGNQHHAVFHQAGHFSGIGLHFLAFQQIFDAQGSDIAR